MGVLIIQGGFVFLEFVKFAGDGIQDDVDAMNLTLHFLEEPGIVEIGFHFGELNEPQQSGDRSANLVRIGEGIPEKPFVVSLASADALA